MDTVELEARELLADWANVRVENCGPFWLVAGTDPQGVARSGTRIDPVSLAHDLAEQGRYVEPEPEPFIAPEPVSAAPESVTQTADAAPSESPPAPDGGSVSDEYSAYFDEPAPSTEPSGIGVMVNNTGGVMAADRTEELRAKKIGETVMEHRRLVDASFTVDEAHTLQQLRSRSNAAVDGTGNPLTDEEQDQLDRLAVEETWAARMDTELQRRLAMLNEADSEYLQTYSPRGGWE